MCLNRLPILAIVGSENQNQNQIKIQPLNNKTVGNRSIKKDQTNILNFIKKHLIANKKTSPLSILNYHELWNFKFWTRSCLCTFKKNLIRPGPFCLEVFTPHSTTPVESISSFYWSLKLQFQSNLEWESRFLISHWVLTFLCLHTQESRMCRRARR